MDSLAAETATPLQYALVMAALADGRSEFAHTHLDDHTRTLINGLLSLGVAIIVDPETGRIDVAGTGGYWPNSDAELEAGDSFPLTCVMVAACSVGRGQYTVRCHYPPGNDQPFVPLLSGLMDLRASVLHDVKDEHVVINVGPEALRGGVTRLPVGCPAAVLESLLVAAPYAAADVMIEARGTTAHAVDQLIPLMDAFGIAVVQDAGRFIVAAPQRYRGHDISDWI